MKIMSTRVWLAVAVMLTLDAVASFGALLVSPTTPVWSAEVLFMLLAAPIVIPAVRGMRADRKLNEVDAARAAYFAAVKSGGYVGSRAAWTAYQRAVSKL